MAMAMVNMVGFLVLSVWREMDVFIPLNSLANIYFEMLWAILALTLYC